MLCGPSLINHINGAVRQFTVIDVTGRQINGGFHRVIGVSDLVVVLKIRLDPAQDLHCIIEAWLSHIDFLEPAAERTVLFEMLSEFLVGRGPHAPKPT